MICCAYIDNYEIMCLFCFYWNNNHISYNFTGVFIIKLSVGNIIVKIIFTNVAVRSACAAQTISPQNYQQQLPTSQDIIFTWEKLVETWALACQLLGVTSQQYYNILCDIFEVVKLCNILLQKAGR